MGCLLPNALIDEVIAFHRHSCPGLAMGIRAAEYAMKLFPDVNPGDFVCVTETDMCGVDAIQYIAGCSYGKGNLIHKDYGKTAFTFFDRKNARGARLLFSPKYPEEIGAESVYLAEKRKEGELSADDNERNTVLRAQMTQWLMDSELDEIYAVEEVTAAPPRRAMVLASFDCESCGEKTMESRTRRFGGKTLCIPCFQQVEQKI